MTPATQNVAGADAIAGASAMVMAGNGQIFHHALAALRHFRQPTPDTILVVSSGAWKYHEAVVTAAASHRWAHVFCALEPSAPGPHSPPPSARWFLPATRSFFQHLHGVARCSRFFRRVARVRTQPLRLLIGGFYGHPIERTACSRVAHEEFVLVDDGNMTGEVARHRGAEQAAGFRNALRHNSTFGFTGAEGCLKLWLYKALAGVRDRGSERITFFTHHHDIPLVGEDRLIKYDPAAGQSPVSVLPDTVHFLGMPALMKKIVSPESFGLLLDWVAKRYRGSDLHYFGHPAEGEAEFRLVRQHVPQARIHVHELAYEQEYARMANVPAMVAGFYSSAIFNLAARGNLKSRIELLEIPEPWILWGPRRERVRQICRNAERHPAITFVPYAPREEPAGPSGCIGASATAG